MGQKIYIASDHGGFELKKSIYDYLNNFAKYEVVDLGTDSQESVDYPDFGHLLASKVAAESGSLGVLVCGTGIGISIAANRHQGVRAALVTNEFMAKMAKQHNNANVLALGGRVLNKDEAIGMVDVWLNETFEGGRHERRVAKLENSTGE